MRHSSSNKATITITFFPSLLKGVCMHRQRETACSEMWEGQLVCSAACDLLQYILWVIKLLPHQHPDSLIMSLFYYLDASASISDHAASLRMSVSSKQGQQITPKSRKIKDKAMESCLHNGKVVTVSFVGVKPRCWNPTYTI